MAEENLNSTSGTEDEIRAGDVVECGHTGRFGTVLEVKGKNVLVRRKQLYREPFNSFYRKDELRKIEIPLLQNNRIRAVVRGELSVYKLTHDQDVLLYFAEGADYAMNPDDLEAGLKRAAGYVWTREEKRAWLKQVMNWFDDDDVWYELTDADDRVISETTVTACLYDLLQSGLRSLAVNEWDLDDLKTALDIIKTWKRFGHDPDRLEEYPDEMLEYLVTGLHQGNIDEQPVAVQDLFRRCIDILCERENTKAIKTRGYCLYCGTKCYPRDWMKARDDFRALYDATALPYAADVLGYLAYYGRCNGGVPEYEEAYHWFSIGAAGGDAECTYKLGDLFYNGYCVAQNRTTAYRLFKRVYDSTLKYFLVGSARTNFPDAARRLGDCYRDGGGCEANPEKAYAFYLQAMTALRMRMGTDPRIGDEKVLELLTGRLRDQREHYTEQAKTMYAENPFWLEWVTSSGRKGAELTWEEGMNGRLYLTVSCLPEGGYGEPPRILATFPAGDYCALLPKITVRTDKGATVTAPEGADRVLFDDYGYDPEEKCTVLFRTGEKVAEIRTAGYRFFGRGKKLT